MCGRGFGKVEKAKAASSHGSCSCPALSDISSEDLGTELGSPSVYRRVSLWWPRGCSGTSPEDPEIRIPWSPAGLWPQSPRGAWGGSLSRRGRLGLHWDTWDRTRDSAGASRRSPFSGIAASPGLVLCCQLPSPPLLHLQ